MELIVAIEKARPASVLQQLDDHLINKISLETRQRHFYPTSASCIAPDGTIIGACARKVVLEFWGYPITDPAKADMHYVWGLGKSVETMCLEWFKQMGIYKANAVRFYDPDFNLSGELDGVLCEAPGSKNLFGWECKSGHGNYFITNQITGKNGVPPAPKDENLLQVCVYLDYFKQLPYFNLMYIGRDDCSRTEYIIRLTEIDGKKYPQITRASGSTYIDKRISTAAIYNRYMDYALHASKDILPKADFKPIMTQEEVDKELEDGLISKAKHTRFTKGESLTTSWRCVYCQFKTYCRSLPQGEVARKDLPDIEGKK